MMSGWPQCLGEESFAAVFLSKGPQPTDVTAHESHQRLALGFSEIILPSYNKAQTEAVKTIPEEPHLSSRCSALYK